MRPCASTLEAETSPDEQEFLLGLIRQERFPGRHLEIGTAAGGTLWRMMQCFEDGRRPRFVVVDPMSYFPEQLQTVRRNLALHGLDPHQVEFRVRTSAEAFISAESQQEKFDFILIDGSHRISAVMADLRWTRLLNPGGIVCLHDYTRRHKGILFAADRFLAGHPNYERIGCHGTLLALRKTGPCPHPEVTTADRLYALMLSMPLQLERKLTNRGKRFRRSA